MAGRANALMDRKVDENLGLSLSLKGPMNDQMMVGQQKQPYPGKANCHW